MAAAIMALALVLPGWAAALIVGGALLVVAAVLGLLGKKNVSEAAPPGCAHPLPPPGHAPRGARALVQFSPRRMRSARAHQELLCTPGSSPRCAISRRHTRHRPNLR
ncbi:phage holin family protein [Nocardia cyriacigeorgica]|uniref:phage holin family protein n=1 Tax=Nocardia cyriacigeorgica TaxID=135487 RepID=UPI002455565D|nr:phage holin family protein [Nocardia cyriacigeorgica]